MVALKIALATHGRPAKRVLDLDADDPDACAESSEKRPRTDAEWAALELELFGPEPEGEPLSEDPKPFLVAELLAIAKPYKRKQPVLYRCVLCGGLYGPRSDSLIGSCRIPAVLDHIVNDQEGKVECAPCRQKYMLYMRTMQAGRMSVSSSLSGTDNSADGVLDSDQDL